jgi:ribosomal protein L40E
VPAAQVKVTPAFKAAGELRLYSTVVLTAVNAISSIRPVRVCDSCGAESEPSQDSEPCRRCDGHGFLTSDEVDG